MIKEAYVSFEVAKLLKKKGFDIPCYGRYSARSQEFHLDTTRPCNNGGIFQYSAPTHQMATKWLREVHDIFIKFESVTASDITEWHPSLNLITENKYIHANKLHWYPSYEEAVEAACLYALKNLIANE